MPFMNACRLDGPREIFTGPFPPCKKVATRQIIAQVHDLEIKYSRADQTIRWFVDCHEVIVASDIGVPINDPEVKIILDHGGVDTIVEPEGLKSWIRLVFAFGHGRSKRS